MALQKFTDAAGREAWLDTSTNMVYTGGGKTPTYYTKDAWNQRQVKKYGSSSGGGSSSSESFATSLVDSSKKQIEEQTSYVEKYLKKNPFAFDEALAKESATAEYQPYYSELLSDYLKGVELQKGSIASEKKLQTELQKYQEGTTSREYAKAVSKAEEGFAGSGLFFSGIKERATGELGVENQATKETQAAQNEATNYGLTNREQTLDLGAEQKKRDIVRQQEEAIQEGILTRQSEAEKAYYEPLVSSYMRKYPTASTGVLSGYLPSEYLRY
jgi:glycyl-tRNA synthetase (class II)